MAFSFSQGDEIHRVTGGCVAVSFIVLGMIDNNVYLVDDGEGGVVLVDPSTHPETIMAAVDGRPVSAILCTHNHWDHVGALRALRDETGARVVASAVDAKLIEAGQGNGGRRGANACPVDQKVSDGQTVQVGRITFTVMATPGHTPGGVCYLVKPEDGTNSQGAPVLVSGDTLFFGSIGRTDFEGGDMGAMRASMRLLATLDDATIVLPGHNQTTSIGAERQRTINAYS